MLEIKKFYVQSFLFWFLLLVIAMINAIIRDLTYKPLLEPYIGMWAHQISSLTLIILFFIAIYLFLKYTKEEYTRKDIIIIGLLWIILTLIFESLMNLYRQLTILQIIETYYFWRGETWIFVLLSLIIIPVIYYYLLKKSKNT